MANDEAMKVWQEANAAYLNAPYGPPGDVRTAVAVIQAYGDARAREALERAERGLLMRLVASAENWSKGYAIGFDDARIFITALKDKPQ